jgi:hypothetical protein
MSDPLLPPAPQRQEESWRNSSATDRTLASPQAARANENINGGTRRRLFICVLLHLGLVGMHIALLLTVINHWEHRVTFSIETSRRLKIPLLVTALTQIAGTVGSILISG